MRKGACAADVRILVIEHYFLQTHRPLLAELPLDAQQTIISMVTDRDDQKAQSTSSAKDRIDGERTTDFLIWKAANKIAREREAAV